MQLARNGEEVVLTKAGLPVAKITGIVDATWPERRKRWLEELRVMRNAGDTGKRGSPTTEEILAEMREERV